MSSRITRSRKDQQAHLTQAPDTSNKDIHAPAAATIVAKTAKKARRSKKMRATETVDPSEPLAVPQQDIVTADPKRPAKTPVKTSSAKTMSKLSAESAMAGHKRTSSTEPGGTAAKKTKRVRAQPDAEPVKQHAAKYMLPSLDNLDDGPGIVPKAIVSSDANQERTHHAEAPLPKQQTDSAPLEVTTVASEDEPESSGASSSEFSNDGTDEDSSSGQSDSDLEIMEKDPMVLGRQLSAERPTWTTSDAASADGTSKGKEAVSSKPEATGKKYAKGNRTSKTKTPKQPNIEHPTWKTPVTNVEGSKVAHAPIQKKEEEESGVDRLGPGAGAPTVGDATQGYVLVLPEKTGPLNLMVQHPDVQAAARHSFPRVERELLTIHAFPNMLIRRGFVRAALAASANELGLEVLEAQILKNESFARTLGGIPSQRISTFRKELKELSQNAAVAYYGLAPGACAPKVEWLLSELIYIYPNLDFERTNGSWEKPYSHPLIVYVIQQAFFEGQGSHAQRFPEMFKSSLADRKEELELPMAMVALVCTTIHAGLLQWKTGQYTKMEFTGNAFIDKYREHITLMQHTLEKNRRGYHTTMHNLYKSGKWIYGKGYQQVPEQTDCDVNPDTTPLSPKLAEIEREYVIPVNIRGEVVPFTTSGSPRLPNEWAVRYVDGAAVYVRYIPNSVIKANIPCWSWTENKETTCLLPLLSVLAFGANDIAIEFPPVDGVIGLSVPHVSSLADWRHSISHRVQFIDALENPKSRVYEPRHFLMKLNHPDKIIDCHNSGAHNLLYFGEDFPCVLKPRFTPKLAVYPTSGKLDPPGNRPWMLGLESMSLIVPNHDPFEFKIDMINPFRDNASALPEYDNMIHVVLDSCTSATYLPAYVAHAIRHKWLQNSQDILKLDENEEVRRYTGYCGPERDLHDCDIVFTFVGEDGQSVNFQCPALPFLKSHYPLPSHKDESPPTRFICSVGSFADSKIPDKDRSYFILGINFYWSAFIDHCGMIKDPTTPVSDYSKFSSPYVRLAPQRARKEDGTMGHAEDFSFLRDVAPKFYEPVQET
ncbi:hypothetical protein TRAPUB_7420 [Trametes pubescens]|uniref:DUF6532 domain-containing protein n=1 Tax=Trametes pubescens TaxID=154538 RepID=A0A1M2V3G0_TRAPU|nr:hypothetical protein TRAPUB_7420 [Trametes pubescens]